MQNVSSTFLAQFANSPTMLALLNTMNLWVDPSANLANFYANVWNVATAEGYGLDRIGRVVGVSRRISTPDYIANQFFAFKENTPRRRCSALPGSTRSGTDRRRATSSC